MLKRILFGALLLCLVATPSSAQYMPSQDPMALNGPLSLSAGDLTFATTSQQIIWAASLRLKNVSGTLAIRNSNDTDSANLDARALTLEAGGSGTYTIDANGHVASVNTGDTCWSSSAVASGGKDLCMYRVGASVLGLATTSGGTGNADLQLKPSVLTAGTMTATADSLTRCSVTERSWTNAMVVALGAVTAGDIAVATLPAKTIVKNAYVIINTPDTSANALTVAVGRTSATYIDYTVASDAKAAANTVYGDASGERGTNLTGYDLPSITGTTVVNAHFIKTTSNLSTVLGSTGTVVLETCTIP